MTNDPELEAIGSITAALTQLEDDQARARVLRYANERFGVLSREGHRSLRPAQEQEHAAGAPRRQLPVAPADRTFDDFADLFDTADPTSDLDKAMTGAYWIQCCIGEASWGAYRVNNLLKDMGHGVVNITTALTSAQKHKPARVRQTAKSGRSRQARKTYKLTTAGVKYVREKVGLSGTVPVALADSGEDNDE